MGRGFNFSEVISKMRDTVIHFSCLYLLAALLIGCSGQRGTALKIVHRDANELAAEAEALVARLGDDDYKVRSLAQNKLETMRTTVLPTVKAAVEKSTDPEIKIRGGMVLKVLEERASWENHGKEHTNSIGMKLVRIPAGEFLMGSPEMEKDRDQIEGPQHKVKITKPFYLGITTVTQEQWRVVMGTNPSAFKGDKLPVERVSWYDCQDFLKKLSAKDGKTYRLPTEAEWEYACRAGTTTPFNTGETINTDQANYDGNHIYGSGEKGVYREKTTPVGTFKPNAWGLYDMHGNVWQWCEDWYDEDYYKNSPVADPIGPAQGANRVLRGGSWCGVPNYCRSAFRYCRIPSYDVNFPGFRVVLVIPVATEPAQPPGKGQNDASAGQDDEKKHSVSPKPE
jgi:formylglycine-generating enzyme required for sulfatase activity